MRSPRPKIDVRAAHRRLLELRIARQAVRRNLATQQRRVRNREQQTRQPLSPSARLVHRFQPTVRVSGPELNRDVPVAAQSSIVSDRERSATDGDCAGFRSSFRGVAHVARYCCRCPAGIADTVVGNGI